MPEISVIILSYNTKLTTLECLDRLKSSIEFLKKPVEVIVIENGNDGTGKIVKEKYDWVKLIEPAENTGFAKGNNIGIRLSNKECRYYLFLNSDAFIERETLAESVKYMENNNQCEVMGCKLKFANGRFQPSAGYLPDLQNITFWMLGLDFLSQKQVHPKSKDFFAVDREVGWVMGAYLFMKSEVVKKTQGFDEKFFMYMEEVEWCKRIQDLGYKIWYTPRFEITHLDKTSSKGVATVGIVKEATGLIYYARKYFPKRLEFIKTIVKIGMGMRALIFGILGNKVRANAHVLALKQI